MLSAADSDPAERKYKKVRIAGVGILEEVRGNGISQTFERNDLRTQSIYPQKSHVMST